ncbi:MAG: ATP-binding cassette domain-containing protein [Methanomassiliicoccus sp.]|nr:ATP-binding cassette domain-containing protein [Methanomassiliicoccus sp.]
MTDPPILSTKKLSFAYQNGSLALKEISLDINRQRKIVLLGPNGAGKSTLFLHFNGILRPKSGEVLYMGAPIRYDAKSLATLRQDIALVLQNPDDQIFSTTVEEDVAFGPLNLELDRDEVERRVEDSLHLVGMEDLRRRPTHQLSFGQRKRVSLAGALAMRPKVLIMDEPTAGLDSEMVHELMELSDELNHAGMTLIMSTHDIETAYEWADEMVVMMKGEVLFTGLPEELFAQHELMDRLRIVPPFPVRFNQQMHVRTGRAEAPYPRNLVEVTHKFFPRPPENGMASEPSMLRPDPSGGTLYIMDVEDPGLARQVQEIGGDRPEMHYRSGAYGARARRMVREGKIDVHHPFHALENALLQVSVGNDYLLYTDTSLLSLVGSELAKVERRVGLRTRVVFGAHAAGGRELPSSTGLMNEERHEHGRPAVGDS